MKGMNVRIAIFLTMLLLPSFHTFAHPSCASESNAVKAEVCGYACPLCQSRVGIMGRDCRKGRG